MSGFFDTVYYGNMLSQWLIALLLIVLFFIIGKAVYWISNRWIKSLTSKTQTQIDDIIVDMVEEPLVVIITLIGVRYSLTTLNLSDNAAHWLGNAFQFVIALIVAWLALRLYDAFHKEYFVKLAQKTETDLDDQLLPIIRTGIKFIVISLGILIGLNNAGYDVGAILAGLVHGGVNPSVVYGVKKCTFSLHKLSNALLVTTERLPPSCTRHWRSGFCSGGVRHRS